jgi:hypothetical protein
MFLNSLKHESGADVGESFGCNVFCGSAFADGASFFSKLTGNLIPLANLSKP